MQSPQNYRWQNGKQYNSKTNSTQSALARRECQGCTGPPPPSLHSYIGSLQKFLVFVISRNVCKKFYFVFREIFLKFRKVQNYFVKISCFAKFKIILSKFCVTKLEENLAKRKIKNFVKTKLLQQPYSYTIFLLLLTLPSRLLEDSSMPRGNATLRRRRIRNRTFPFCHL